MLKIQPRKVQETALNMLRREWKQHRTYMLSASVGFGKTVIAALVIDGMFHNGLKILFVAPYTILIEQTVNRLVEYGFDPFEISIIWRNHPAYDPNKRVQIASADTLARRDIPNDVDLIIIDEAHLKRKFLLEYIRDTKARVLGLSGTPFSKWLGNYYETLLKPTTMKDLIACGDLSPYEFYAPTKPDLSGVKTQNTELGADYNEQEIDRIMCGSDLVANIVQNWLANGENRSTICFCVTVAHANYIVDEFNRNGVNAAIMTANTPQDERQLIIRRYEQGIIKVLVNVGVLVAGFDSDVRCIIFARPTKSEIRWIQCLGRGLRSAPGKDKCVIFDHSGTVHRLGFPDDIEYDYLIDKDTGLKTVKRVDVEVKEKLPKECPECKFLKPVGIYECPKCGHRPVYKEDISTDESRSLQKLKSKKKEFTQEDKQYFWSQIKFYQKERSNQGKPLSDGWCSHVYKKKFGVWPRGLHDSIIETSPEVRNYITHYFMAYAKGKNANKKIVKEKLSTLRTLLKASENTESITESILLERKIKELSSENHRSSNW